jgi:hypothetical protein
LGQPQQHAGNAASPAKEAVFITLLGSKSSNVISSVVAILQALAALLIAFLF